MRAKISFVTVLAGMLWLLMPSPVRALGLDAVLCDMGNAPLEEVKEDAEGLHPQYSSAPPADAVPVYETFEGDFYPASNNTQVAVFSDDGVDVTVDDVKILNKIDVGQHLPNLDQSFHVLQLQGGWETGRAYHIVIDYSNICHPDDSDIDGCTLYTYNGGGSTTDDWYITVTKCPKAWLPTGKTGSPSTVGITATIHPSSTTGVINFEIEASTCRPGYCTNAGTESDSDSDLKIEPQEGFTTNPTKTWACTLSPVSSATVTVSCYDYGAWGKIKATVTIDGVEKTAVAEGTPHREYVTVPRDNNENMIGDAWSHDGLNNDIDTTPVGINVGDGFSRYEEYRGFMVGGAHVRTDPDVAKDVFVYDKDGLGLGDFPSLGLTVHPITNDEWDSATRKVNFKEANDQCGVYMQDGGYHWFYLGYCFGGPGTPNQITGVDIYTQRIREWGGENDSRDIWEAADIEVKNSVIGHECGHAVSIPHHNYGVEDCVMYNPCPSRTAPPHRYCISNPGCASKSKLH